MDGDRPPRSSFTVLTDWLNGADSSDSGSRDSSSEDLSLSSMASSDSSDSVDSDSSDSPEDKRHRSEPRTKSRFHHKHPAGKQPAPLPRTTAMDGSVPADVLVERFEDNVVMWVNYEPIRVDPDPLFEKAPLRRERFVSDSTEELMWEPHGHHHGRRGRFHDHSHHENSHHDHLRYRNRLPDDFDRGSWHDSFEGDFEDCDFVQGLLAFFFFIGAFTLFLLPFVLFARALKRLARGTASSRFPRSSSTPPGPSSSAFGVFARRRESNTAAASAAAAGYQPLPEEPTTAQDDDDDAIVVTGTPVNPPPSVNI